MSETPGETGCLCVGCNYRWNWLPTNQQCMVKEHIQYCSEIETHLYLQRSVKWSPCNLKHCTLCARSAEDNMHQYVLALTRRTRELLSYIRFLKAIHKLFWQTDKYFLRMHTFTHFIFSFIDACLSIKNGHSSSYFPVFQMWPVCTLFPLHKEAGVSEGVHSIPVAVSSIKSSIQLIGWKQHYSRHWMKRSLNVEKIHQVQKWKWDHILQNCFWIFSENGFIIISFR